MSTSTWKLSDLSVAQNRLVCLMLHHHIRLRFLLQLLEKSTSMLPLSLQPYFCTGNVNGKKEQKTLEMAPRHSAFNCLSRGREPNVLASLSRGELGPHNRVEGRKLSWDQGYSGALRNKEKMQIGEHTFIRHINKYILKNYYIDKYMGKKCIYVDNKNMYLQEYVRNCPCCILGQD